MKIIVKQNRHDSEMVELYRQVVRSSYAELQLISTAHIESFSDIALSFKNHDEVTLTLTKENQ